MTVKEITHIIEQGEGLNAEFKTSFCNDAVIDDQHTLEDISLDKIINFAQKSPRLSDEKDPLRLLQKYELVRNGHITKAAFLLFVKDFTVLTGIQVGRFKSPTKIIDSISIHSDLFSEVGEVMSFLRKHFMVEYIITGNPQREERYDYPEEAIREIVLNMIVHRDYRDGGDSIIKIFDDRIEFFNPGKLIDGLTIERLLSDNYSPKARNVLINTMFKEIGWVEKYGSGIQRIINACQEHGGVNIDFRLEQHGFMVVVTKKVRQTDGTVEETDVTVEKTGSTVEEIDSTVEKTGRTVEKTMEKTGRTVEETDSTVEKTKSTAEKTVEETDTTVEKILEIITNNPQITQIQLVEMTGLTRRGIEWNLSKLKANGLIERVGPDKGGYWKVIKDK